MTERVILFKNLSARKIKRNYGLMLFFSWQRFLVKESKMKLINYVDHEYENTYTFLY